MSRSTHLRQLIAFVQIIALMICTLAWGVCYVRAEETTETVQTTTVTETTDTTVPVTDTTTSVPPVTEQTTVTTTTLQTTAIFGSTATPATTTTTPSDKPSQEVLDSVQALQQNRQELQSQALALQEQRKYYSDTLDGLLPQKKNLEEQIAIKQREIDVNDQLKGKLSEQIFLNDRELMEQEQAILVRRQSILQRFESIRQKLRAMSKDGNLSVVQVLASSEDYTDFLINNKMARRMTAIDEAAMNELEDELRTINEKRRLLRMTQEKLEAEREPYVNASRSLEKTRFELIVLLDDAKQIALQLNSNLSYNRMEYLTLSEQHTFLQKQIGAILQDYDTESIAPTEMHWPAPECTIITSSFKSRWNRWHYGLDIASWGDSTGKTIVPAADGTVIFADEDNSGFGKYVIVDHGFDILGQRIVTLYAHCSALYVSKGDIVFGGSTPLAAVGNTGDSDGAHLHFEVRVNGTAVDPIGEGYLSTKGITVSG